MNLAYGYVAQTLQMHDELDAGRVNERRRNAADRRALQGERSDGRRGLAGRFAEWRQGRGRQRIHGLPVAHCSRDVRRPAISGRAGALRQLSRRPR